MTRGLIRLLDTVLDKIGDPGFRDAIVVQGVAGAGNPLLPCVSAPNCCDRVCVPFAFCCVIFASIAPVEEALAQVIRLGEDAYSPAVFGNSRPDDLFAGGVIFKEQMRFGTAEICPSNLI